MSRSLWKGPYFSWRFLDSVGLLPVSGSSLPSSLPSRSSNRKVTPSASTHILSRNSTILPSFVGVDLSIHNGLKFVPLRVSQDSVGHKFGEFSLTRKGKNLNLRTNKLKKSSAKSSH